MLELLSYKSGGLFCDVEQAVEFQGHVHLEIARWFRVNDVKSPGIAFDDFEGLFVVDAHFSQKHFQVLFRSEEHR